MSHPAFSTRKTNSIPVHLVDSRDFKSGKASLPGFAIDWAKRTGFSGKKGTLCLVPDGSAGGNGIACALFGLGDDPRALDAGRLPRLLPEGNWHFADAAPDATLSSLGWLLGAYRYDRYRKDAPWKARLVPGADIDTAAISGIADSVFLARDLINTPTNDLGPAELEAAIRKLAGEFKAKVGSIVGDKLLEKNFPMVHAVGRASASAPRIVEFKWGKASDPKVTLVGKGVCFDSGGLNIKPGDSMALMKKDMGGAANILALARMIMTARLPVRLRVIIAAVENSISANAFRPGDILNSRKGTTVEIGNTDAEGRLILGDALAWGDEEAPQIMIDMATLTGAARIALGPDLPAMFSDDDGFCADMMASGASVEDPVWRLPLWKGYRAGLSSNIANISHIGKGPQGGSITAALFLQHFVEKAKTWAHFDIFAWAAAEKPSCPIGGEAQAIRAIFEVMKSRFPVA
ncbi:MAG: leucyl aminopeptidase family protein [Nitratireductor sp.]|nr:leucyl aminopeptidase family protein [Nitratireductor sp.]